MSKGELSVYSKTGVGEYGRAKSGHARAVEFRQIVGEARLRAVRRSSTLADAASVTVSRTPEASRSRVFRYGSRCGGKLRMGAD